MAANVDFREFVERQRPPADDHHPDWIQVRDDWLRRVDELYGDIAVFLKDFIDSGDIGLKKSHTEINEEHIGAYRAPRLTVVIGIQEIILTPVRTLLIGAKGRVDVEGSAGTSRLILTTQASSKAWMQVKPSQTLRKVEPKAAEDINWTWRIVSRPPAMAFVDLNKDSFFAMLMEVSSG